VLKNGVRIDVGVQAGEGNPKLVLGEKKSICVNFVKYGQRKKKDREVKSAVQENDRRRVYARGHWLHKHNIYQAKIAKWGQYEFDTYDNRMRGGEIIPLGTELICVGQPNTELALWT